MPAKVLVVHDSKYGGTRQIAEAIAETLADRSLDVTLLPAGEVGSVDEYQGVVIGSAVYMGRWRHDALKLLRRQQQALTERDVWLFNSGPVGLQPTEGEEAERWLRPPKVVALGAEIGVHDNAVFGGAVDLSGGPMRRGMARSTPEEARDLRDWDEIRAWAGEVASALEGGKTSGPTG